MSTNEMILLAVIALAIGYAIYDKLSKTKVLEIEKVTKVPPLYSYRAKECIMTPSEAEFFEKLHSAVGDRYYIFPQIHLSALLDEKVVGQNWNAAFRHINGKSVDYVLCDKVTLKPAYAVELDDASHERADRRERDEEVERIFKEVEAGMRLVRLRFSDRLEF